MAFSENWESPAHALVSLSLRGMLVLLLLVLCVCFHVACVMYLHLTSVQVRLPDLFSSLTRVKITLLIHSLSVVLVTLLLLWAS